MKNPSQRPRVLPVATFTLLLAGTAHASDDATPSWQHLQDRSGKCEVLVPNGWTLHPGIFASASRPGRSRVGMPTQVSLPPVMEKSQVPFEKRRDALKTQWQSSGEFSVLMDTPERVIYRYRQGAGYQWSELLGGFPACEATYHTEMANDPDAERVLKTLRRRQARD